MKESQTPPSLEAVPHSRFEVVLEILALLVFAAVFFYISHVYDNLPERIAIHFNEKGEADGWGGRSSLYFAPGFLLGIWAFLIVLARTLSPKHYNLAIDLNDSNARALYQLTRSFLRLMGLSLALIALFIVISSIQASQVENGEPITHYLVAVIVCILFPIVYFAFRHHQIKQST